MHWPVLGLIVAGFAISLVLTAWLVRLGHRAGALDSSGSAGHAKQLRHVPNIGGISIYAALALPMVAGILVLAFADLSVLEGVAPGLARHEARLRGSIPTAVALLAGMTILHVMGLVDDRRPLGPGPKLLVQITIALVLAIWFDVRLLELLPAPLSVAITVLWIVGITNALNFLDNMDGLAAGVGAISAGLFLVACLINAQWFIAAVLALLVGGLLGFLIFNFPPARIFMGDGGSLVLGFVLAVLTVRTTFVHEDLGGGPYAVFMPLVILAIPIYDFLTVTAIRLRQGKSPFVGDQQHFSHRLVQRGLSKRSAVLVIWAATLVTGIGGIALGRLAEWQAILVGVQTVCVLLMFALLEAASRSPAPEETR